MGKYIFLFILLFCPLMVFSIPRDSVVIQGNAPEYANMHLIVECKSNYITGEHTELKRFLVDKKGTFRTEFGVSNTTKIFIKLGESVGHLLVEPGKSYEITLPPYRPLKPENKLNPFFVPEPIMLGLHQDDEINRTVRDFEEKYNHAFSKNIQLIVLTRDHQAAKKLIEDVDVKFPADKGSWFDSYKHYKYQILKSYIYSNQKRRVIKEGFSERPVEYNLDPYWEAFNHVFKGFFHFYSSSKYGEDFKKCLAGSSSFDTICSALSNDVLFSKNKELAELVVLKGLYDAFYSNHYEKERVIDIVNGAVSDCEGKRNKAIAKDILTKISKLRVGTQAPNFKLPLLSRKDKELSDFRGKFVYLNFANTQNYSCKKDFQVLSQLADTYKRDMQVVTVLMDDDADQATKYVKSNKLKWTFFHFNQNGKVLDDYNLRAYPTYYLIDPEGNIILAPAPAPEEEFVPIFSEIYNEYRYKKLRKEKPKTRSIYDL
ncbi:TlpA family protein disulfide reductase [Labilibacter sediminis]|nr:TlpA family protein disulfide reductase [Labilibacter sediminis]